MALTQELRQKNSDLWERMATHPFIIELGDDALSHERARRYFLQDYVFVADLVALASLGVAKAPDIQAASQIHAFLNGILDPKSAEENDFFLRTIDALGATEADYAAAAANPVTEGFGNFLMRVGYEGDFEDIATLLYVTEGAYLDWATRLIQQGKQPSNPIYAEWIRLHSPDVLGDFVAWLASHLDAADLGSRRPRIERLFRATLRYEYLFWQAAYDGNAWPDEA